jgi:hypothetical protein
MKTRTTIVAAGALATALLYTAGEARADYCSDLLGDGEQLCKDAGFTGYYWNTRWNEDSLGDWSPMGINWVEYLEPYVRDPGQWSIGNRCGINSEHKTIISQAYTKHDDVGVTYTASWNKGAKASVANLIKSLGVEVTTAFEQGDSSSSHKAEGTQTSESHWMTAPACQFSYERLAVFGYKDATLKVPAMRPEYVQYRCKNHWYSSWSSWRKRHCGFQSDERPVEFEYNNYKSYIYPAAGSAYCGSGQKVPAHPLELENFSADVPDLSGTCLPPPSEYPDTDGGGTGGDHDDSSGSGSGDPDGDGLPDGPIGGYY